MQRFTSFLLSLCVLAGGCSIIVEDQLAQQSLARDAGGTRDSGPTGEVCQTTAQCLGFEGQQFNCRRVCMIPAGETDGRCVSLSAPMATPDGTACGTSGAPMEICVQGACVERGCGDGFRDRLPDTTRPEHCDDGANGDPADGCDDMCTRPCGSGLPNCDDDDPCNGMEVCMDGVCRASAGLQDEAACTTPAEEPGTCVAQRCVAM